MTARPFIAAVLAASAALGHAEPMDGKSLFAKNCAACHQPTGRGIPGAFPALAGNAFVQGAPGDVATVLLKGRGGTAWNALRNGRNGIDARLVERERVLFTCFCRQRCELHIQLQHGRQSIHKCWNAV